MRDINIYNIDNLLALNTKMNLYLSGNFGKKEDM